MASREICLWLDERWYDALTKRLKDETLKEHLEDMIDQMCNELPLQEYERISSEIYTEEMESRQAAEAAKKYAAFHVIENGEEQYFRTDSGMELLQAAVQLRKYLRKEPGMKPEKFAGMIHSAEPITAAAFEQLARIRMENTGKVTGVFELDFDKQEFSALHIMNGWQPYSMKDVSKAAYHAMRKEHIPEDERWYRLVSKLDGKEITVVGLQQQM